MVVLRFNEDDWERLRESRGGVQEFTIARAHGLLSGAAAFTPCLVQGESADDRQLYFGLVSSRAAVTTLESRIKVKRALPIQPPSMAELVRLITVKKHVKSLKKILRGAESVVTLSPEVSGHVIERLASIESNRGALRSVAESLSAPKYFRDAAALQEDAVRTALKAFGVAYDDQARSLDLVAGKETALARISIMEDSVIEHDARHIPGYDLVESYLTGHAIFERGDERLEVFTANRRALERVFGVDLIYLNATKQNIVMLQYKMLEPWEDGDDRDWTYRPDAKLDAEIRRMRRFSERHAPTPHEYRLNPSVFYLKFVKRDGSIRNGSIIVPVDHFETLRSDPACEGPRGGLRLSYHGLSGRYLREGPFIDLIRSGYIGAHGETTSHMRTLVRAVLRNGRSVVAAIQQRMENADDDNEPAVHGSFLSA